MTGSDALPGFRSNADLRGLFLAAFQLGHIDNAWDLFFSTGTERIITCGVPEASPVADAGLAPQLMCWKLSAALSGTSGVGEL